jgi:hypothetical protein
MNQIHWPVSYSGLIFLKSNNNMLTEKEEKFRDELEELINRHSMENGSNTPDFVLAEYLVKCLIV